MNEQKKVWIYERVSGLDKNELLSYQITLLTKYAHENNYVIVGCTRTFDSCKSLESIFMQHLLNSIVSEFMDCILVYFTNQSLIDSDKLGKLELISKMQNVSIIPIK